MGFDCLLFSKVETEVILGGRLFVDFRLFYGYSESGNMEVKIGKK